MIRDVIILTEGGIPLFRKNFGECHGFGKDVDLLSGFIAAIQGFSQNLTGTEIQAVDVGDLQILFHKEARLLYTLMCDITDPREETKVKAKKVAEIFNNTFRGNVVDTGGDVSCYDSFGQVLIDLKLTQKNCGGRPECMGCPNSQKGLPLVDLTNAIRKKSSWWQSIKEKLKIKT